MPRTLTTPTAAAPYLAQWTAAGVDITSSAANSPVVISPVERAILVPIVAITALSKNIVFYVAHINNNAAFAGSVDFAQTLTISTAAANSRRTAAAGAAGKYFGEVATTHVLGGFDLRGVPDTQGESQWVLGILDINTDSAVDLLGWRWV